MAPIDIPYATFYWSAIVNIPYIRAIYNLVPFSSFLTLNNIVTLKLGLEVTMSLKVVPFESLGTVSYSHSIVTMAISCIVCEI